MDDMVAGERLSVAPRGISGGAPFESPRPLSPAEVERFRRVGHVLLRQVVTPEELGTFAPAISEAVFHWDREQHEMERSVRGQSQAWKFVNNLWRLDPWARALVLGKRFGRIAADLLGVRRVRLFRDQSYYKLPGGGNTPWHQDSHFMPLDTGAIVTMWLALSPVDADMAPMWFADGSHEGGYLGTSMPDDDSMDRFEAKLRSAGYPITSYGALGAGDASFHFGSALHASRTNTSSRGREAVVVVFFADGARVRMALAPEGAPREEAFAEVIRRNNLRESLPGLSDGDIAASALTPIVYEA